MSNPNNKITKDFLADKLPFGDKTLEIGGMTLRDYFAAKAIKYFLEQQTMSQLQQPEKQDYMTEAAYCYRIADAMLKERAK